VTSGKPIATSLELRHAMTCKIDRVLTAGGSVVFRVSGRIDDAYFEVLQELIENEKTPKGRLALDLKEVTVVSLEAVRALTVAENNGIELRNCPAYLREWISRWRECGLPE
jgi:hypothetical protein